MNFLVSQIAPILSAKLIGKKENTFSSLITDSRTSGFASQALFTAVKGERHNGHIYIQELYAQGCRCFLVSEEHAYYTELKDASFLLVKNTLLGLQQLAAYKRSLFKIPVVGITGSNGKTIVKEWLWQLLSSDFNICKNPKSYNSQIGVPLSVWQLNEQTNFALFEAGISLPGEMEKLEAIIKPTIGIITNIGSAHDENFTDFLHKATEKILLFKNTRTLIYCKDYEAIELSLKLAEADKNWAVGNKELLSWSLLEKADLQIIYQEEKNNQTFLKALYI